MAAVGIFAAQCVFAFQSGVKSAYDNTEATNGKKKKKGLFFGLGHVLSLQVPCKFGASSGLSEEY